MPFLCTCTVFCPGVREWWLTTCLNGACANVLYSAHSYQHPTLRRDPARSIRAGDEPWDARRASGGRVALSTGRVWQSSGRG